MTDEELKKLLKKSPLVEYYYNIATLEEAEKKLVDIKVDELIDEDEEDSDD